MIAAQKNNGDQGGLRAASRAKLPSRRGHVSDIVLGDAKHFSKDAQFLSTMKIDYIDKGSLKHAQEKLVDVLVAPWKHRHTEQDIDDIPAGKPDGGNSIKSRFEQHIVFGDPRNVRPSSTKLHPPAILSDLTAVEKDSDPAPVAHRRSVPGLTGVGAHVGTQTRLDLPADERHFRSFATTHSDSYTNPPNPATNLAVLSAAAAKRASNSNIPIGDLEKQRCYSTVAMSSWVPFPSSEYNPPPFSTANHHKNPVKSVTRPEVLMGRDETVLPHLINGVVAGELIGTTTHSSTFKGERQVKLDRSQTSVDAHREHHPPLTLVQHITRSTDPAADIGGFGVHSKTAAYLRSKSTVTFGDESSSHDDLTRYATTSSAIGSGQTLDGQGKGARSTVEDTLVSKSGILLAVKPDARFHHAISETCQQSHFRAPNVEYISPSGAGSKGWHIHNPSCLPTGDPSGRLETKSTITNTSFAPPPSQMYENVHFPVRGAHVTESSFDLGDPEYYHSELALSQETSCQRLRSIATTSYIPHPISRASAQQLPGNSNDSVAMCLQQHHSVIGEPDLYPMGPNHTTQQDHFSPELAARGVKPVVAKAPPCAPHNVMFPTYHATVFRRGAAPGAGHEATKWTPAFNPHLPRDESASRENACDGADAHQGITEKEAFYSTTTGRVFALRSGIVDVIPPISTQKQGQPTTTSLSRIG
ncbi:hypothetical protein BJ742DRAFT_851820 [Cladochytrium replicatum]|nr:hypothetical protein BJ742DRAFT_851820 [Cladochytrium replicatum]